MIGFILVMKSSMKFLPYRKCTLVRPDVCKSTLVRSINSTLQETLLKSVFKPVPLERIVVKSHRNELEWTVSKPRVGWILKQIPCVKVYTIVIPSNLLGLAWQQTSLGFRENCLIQRIFKVIFGLESHNRRKKSQYFSIHHVPSLQESLSYDSQSNIPFSIHGYR